MKKSRYMAIAILAVFAGFWVLYMAGGRINRSKSLPIGLYWITEKEPGRGDIVMFRPENSTIFLEAHQRGYIAASGNSYGLLFKKITGIPGDRLSVTDQGVFINGALIENTVPKLVDGAGEPLPRFRCSNFIIPEGMVLLLSNHIPDSFDGRYFGLQKQSQILYVVRPLITY